MFQCEVIKVYKIQFSCTLMKKKKHLPKNLLVCLMGRLIFIINDVGLVKIFFFFYKRAFTYIALQGTTKVPLPHVKLC